MSQGAPLGTDMILQPPPIWRPSSFLIWLYSHWSTVPTTVHSCQGFCRQLLAGNTTNHWPNYFLFLVVYTGRLHYSVSISNIFLWTL
jgi:hypothetical protein